MQKKYAEEEAKRLRTTQSPTKLRHAFKEGEEQFEEIRGPSAVFEFFPDRKVQVRGCWHGCLAGVEGGGDGFLCGGLDTLRC